MTNSQLHSQKPSKPQLGYLRILAEATGETFVFPSTASEADREIKRLKKRRSRSSFERHRERELETQVGPLSGDAAHVRAHELAGFGSTAGWSSEVEV